MQIFTNKLPPDISSVAMILFYVLTICIIYKVHIIKSFLAIGITYLFIMAGSILGITVACKVFNFQNLKQVRTHYMAFIMAGSIEIWVLCVFLYFKKYFIILFNFLTKSKKIYFICLIITQLFLFGVVAMLEFNTTINIINRIVIICTYVIVFIVSFKTIVQDFFSNMERLELIQSSQHIVQQFKSINDTYASQLIKMQLLINSNQLSELKETLKSNIDEVRDASILISKNLDPLFSQGFQLLEEAQADILIDNQIDNLLKLKVDTISMINLLNIISEYIIAKVPVENQTINVKIRDMYDQAQFTISMKNTVFIEKDTNISSEAYQKIIQIINDFHGKIKIKPGIAKLTLNFRLPKNI
jgi:hypothetical protein